MPWELSVEEFRAAVDEATRIRTQAGRTDPLEMVSPFSVPADASASAMLEHVTRWRAAGATAFHVGIGAESWAQYLERLAWFGQHVIARA